MKIKGISIWEQNIERIALGVAAIVFIVLVGRQFIGEPNATKVADKTVTPGDVDETLRQQASQLDAKLNAAPPLALNEAEERFPKFEDLRTASISPAPTLAVWQARLAVGGGDVGPSDKPFVVASIPQPTDLVAQQFTDTLQPDVVAALPELQQITSQAPHDVEWVTVAANFHQGEVHRQFSQPGPNGEAALPVRWTGGRADIVDVLLEREELIDGNWTNATVLEPNPGHVLVELRPVLSKPIDAATRDQVLATVSEPTNRRDIVQPEFYATKGASWSPPTQQDPKAVGDVAGAAEELTIDLKLKGKLAERQEALDRVLKQMKDLGCAATAPEAPAGKTGEAAGGGGGGGLSTGGSRGGLKDPNAVQQQESARCEGLRRSKNRIEEQIADIEEQLAKLGVAVEPEAEQAEPVEEENPDVLRIWAHDLTVEPGKTYRYRFVVHVYNPLFARRMHLIAEQQPLAEKFTLVSPASEWTEPVSVTPPLRLFITKATAAGQSPITGGTTFGSARVEVYRFYDGRWRSETFTVQPGDRIGVSRGGAKEGGIDFSTNWFLLDVVESMVVQSDQDISRGWTARAVLQQLGAAAETQVRLPRDDANDPERIRLREDAALDEAVASN